MNIEDKSIVSVKVMITFQKYRLSFVPTKDRLSFWLSTEDGEGMSVSQENLEDILDEYYKANF